MKGVKKKKGGGELAFFGKCSLLLGGEQVCGFALIRGNKAVFSFLLNPSEVWCNWFNPLLFQVSLLPAETAKEQRVDGRAESWEPRRCSRYGAGCWVSGSRAASEEGRKLS